MAQFSKFKLLFAIKQQFNVGVNYIKKYQKNLYLEVGKSQNKVAAAEEIGCSSKKLNDDLVIKNQVPGWMDGSKSHLRIAYSNQKLKISLILRF